MVSSWRTDENLLHWSDGLSRVPLSTSFGRRPVLLASTLVCFGSAIWRARAQSYGSFMGASVLNGLAAGPAEVDCIEGGFENFH